MPFLLTTIKLIGEKVPEKERRRKHKGEKMPLTDKLTENPQKTMVLVFIIDTSGSMAGSKIGAVNTSIEEAIPAIRELSAETGVSIKIAVLGFSSGIHWITADDPVEAGQFRWNYLNAAGVTDFGAACKALNEKFSAKAFMRESADYIAPVVIVLLDGDPTDDWENSLAELKRNHWFKAAAKVAIAIGDDANKDVLEEFTGSMEAVLEAGEAEALMEVIKFACARVSLVAGDSTIIEIDTGGEEEQNELQATLKIAIEGEAPDNDDEEQREYSEDMGELRKVMTALLKEIAALRKDMAAFTRRNGTAAVNDEEEVW